MTERNSAIFFFVGALLLFWAAPLVNPRPRAKKFPPFTRPVLTDYALTDMSMTMMGLRRFGSDLAFIQLLQYYSGAGERESHLEEGEYHFHGGIEMTADAHPEIPLKIYPDLLSHGFRVVSLDPYFHYAYLFGAGALAFNLNRADEALDLLNRGLAMDPAYSRFLLYVGAIGFQRSNTMSKGIPLLERAMMYPDCPTMVKNILAGIYKKSGNVKRAAEIYMDILQNSRDKDYAVKAAEELDEIREKLGLKK